MGQSRAGKNGTFVFMAQVKLHEVSDMIFFFLYKKYLKHLMPIRYLLLLFCVILLLFLHMEFEVSLIFV